MNTRAFYKKLCFNTIVNFAPILIGVYTTSFIMRQDHDEPEFDYKDHHLSSLITLFRFTSNIFCITNIISMNILSGSIYAVIKNSIIQSNFDQEFWPGLLKTTLSTISTIMISQYNNPLPVAIQFYLTDSMSTLVASIEYESNHVSNDRPVLLPIDTQTKTSRKTFQERLEDIHFQGEIPSEFIDCVEREIMNEPYILNSGHSIDRMTADNILKNGNQKCPISRMNISTCVKNIDLQRAINRFVTALESDYNNRHEKKNALEQNSLFKKSRSTGDLIARHASPQKSKPLPRELKSLL